MNRFLKDILFLSPPLWGDFFMHLCIGVKRILFIIQSPILPNDKEDFGCLRSVNMKFRPINDKKSPSCPNVQRAP
jgi:hypothetical protein